MKDLVDVAEGGSKIEVGLFILSPVGDMTVFPTPSLATTGIVVDEPGTSAALFEAASSSSSGMLANLSSLPS